MERFIEGAIYKSWLKDREYQVLERNGDEITIMHTWYRTTMTLIAEAVVISMNGDMSERVIIPAEEGETGDRIYADSRMN